MSADTAITIFREVAIGQKQASMILFDGEKFTVHIRAPIFATAEDAITSDKLERWIQLARRFEQPYWYMIEDGVFVIGREPPDDAEDEPGFHLHIVQ